MKKILVSLITYNNHDKTHECIDSLQKSVTSGFELHIRIIDNHSKTPFVLKKTYSHIDVTVDISVENRGFSGGHNQNALYADVINADYFVVLNNDTTVEKHMIKTLFSALEDDKTIAAVAPKMYFTAGQEYHHTRYSEKDRGKVIWYAGGEMDWNNVVGKHRGVDIVDAGQFDQNMKTEFVTGACMMLRTQLFKSLNGFDERYFLYYEDTDLSMRLRNFGSLFFISGAMLWHDNAGSTGGSGSNLQDYFISRNRLLFGMQYAPLRTKIALVRESFRIARTGRSWQKVGIKDFFKRNFGKGSYPVSD